MTDNPTPFQFSKTLWRINDPVSFLAMSDHCPVPLSDMRR